MKRYHRQILLIFLIMATCLCTYGQDFTKDIKSMRKAFDESTHLHVVMEITVYESDTSSVPYFFEKAEIFRAEGKYSYKLKEREMLLSEDRLIVVNNNTLEISVSKRDLDSESFISQQMNFNLDSILNLYENPIYLGVQDQLKHYKLYQESDLINRIDLFMETSEGLLKKLHYYYTNGQFVTINFKVLNLKPEIKEGTFAEERYITRANGKLKGLGKYSIYNVYEQ
jgi:hypothetical protein